MHRLHRTAYAEMCMLEKETQIAQDGVCRDIYIEK